MIKTKMKKDDKKSNLKEKRSEDDEWPEGYFDLMGSVEDDSFVVPEDMPFDKC